MVTKATEPRRIEYLDLDSITGADNNPKRHEGTLIEDSIKRFSFTEPAVLDERTQKLVAGHGRLAQLRVMRDRGDSPPEGVTVVDGRWQMPVLRGWASVNDTEAQAYLIASNRITERGGWDAESLVAALDALEGELAGVGFAQADLDNLKARLEETMPSTDDVEWDDNEGHDESSSEGQRSLTLDYSLPTFERVVELAAHARKQHGVNSNADLFLRLLERESADG